jgi:RHS repeat-associated protein
LTTPTYDHNGNLTKDEQGQTYTYDAWNRLVQVKNSGNTVIASYAYDAMGRRIQETHSGTVNDLYYSAAWQVLEERTGGVSTATIQYVWSPVYVDALILRDRSTQNNGTLDERLWVQQDANWNVTALVNSSGSVVERYVYDPYGQVTYLNASFGTISGSAYGWIYGFQGLRLDTATGNNQGREREYRATIGRFLQNDPLGIRAGDTNFYRFVGNDPTNITDPSGEIWPVVLGGMAIAGILLWPDESLNAPTPSDTPRGAPDPYLMQAATGFAAGRSVTSTQGIKLFGAGVGLNLAKQTGQMCDRNREPFKYDVFPPLQEGLIFPGTGPIIGKSRTATAGVGMLGVTSGVQKIANGRPGEGSVDVLGGGLALKYSSRPLTQAEVDAIWLEAQVRRGPSQLDSKFVGPPDPNAVPPAEVGVTRVYH